MGSFVDYEKENYCTLCRKKFPKEHTWCPDCCVKLRSTPASNRRDNADKRIKKRKDENG
jgi:predicted amidophosphoribosyltransferase